MNFQDTVCTFSILHRTLYRLDWKWNQCFCWRNRRPKQGELRVNLELGLCVCFLRHWLQKLLSIHQSLRAIQCENRSLHLLTGTQDSYQRRDEIQIKLHNTHRTNSLILLYPRGTWDRHKYQPQSFWNIKCWYSSHWISDIRQTPKQVTY